MAREREPGWLVALAAPRIEGEGALSTAAEVATGAGGPVARRTTRTVVERTIARLAVAAPPGKPAAG